MVDTLSDELARVPNHVVVFMESHVKGGCNATFGKLPNTEPKNHKHLLWHQIGC